MEFCGSNGVDIFKIYAEYCDIMSRNDQRSTREALSLFSKALQLKGLVGDKVFTGLRRLMSHLNLAVDSYQFTHFYDFVFFLCRENGQKNISVNLAISAWRLVLTGRFRLLKHWCDFVEKHQRHNITQDSWQQLLAFSRCVNEDLEGYDPTGAWPVLIDDFVEHMYRANEASNCIGMGSCNCDQMEQQQNFSNSFHGLSLLPGSKRKFSGETAELKEECTWANPTSLKPFNSSKRLRHESGFDRLGYVAVTANLDDAYRPDANAHKSLGCHSHLTCAVEDNLSKVFEGHLSMACCFPFGQNSGLSFT